MAQSASVSPLRSAPGKRQQCDVARLFDGGRQASLVRRADSGQAARNDLAALRHKLRQQPDVFVVDGLNFLHAELADLLAAKIFTSTFAATGSARTWGAALAIGPVAKRRTISSRGPIPARRALPPRTCSRCCRCSSFFSHDAP